MNAPRPSGPRPAVLTRRIADLPPDHPMPLLERRRIIGEKAMISHVRLAKGCLVPVHAHENEQFTCILSGRLRFTLDGGRTVDVVEGGVIHLPGNCPHGAEALEDTIVLDIFAPPSQATGIDRR